MTRFVTVKELDDNINGLDSHHTALTVQPERKKHGRAFETICQKISWVGWDLLPATSEK